MAWRRPGDKPLSEPMMVWLLTHIWVDRPQWVKQLDKFLKIQFQFLILFAVNVIFLYEPDQILYRYFECLVQECSKSIAKALGLLQSCTKPSILSALWIMMVWCFSAKASIFDYVPDIVPMHFQLFMHYYEVIMGTKASQITSLAIVYSTVYSGADQRKHQSSASLAFVWGIHRGLVNSPHKWPVTRKMFPFDDVIMGYLFDRCFIKKKD